MQTQVQQSDILEPGALIGDHFVVRKQLGSGGIGDVYLAEHASLPDIKCAVKVLRREFSGNASFVEILRAEARKQSRLQHDNVVQIHDFFEWHGRYCLVQSFVSGATLSQIIADSPGGLESSFALRLICEVLSGLDYAHEQGILHCDIKPSNIIVDESGRARILDFGIARDLGTSAGDSELLTAGTPAYMSPEQIMPPYQVDHRTDVYSSGVMLFEMLSGRLPFGNLPPQVDAQMPQLRLDPPDIRRVRADIPEVMARIVVTAMQRDRDRRFAGCCDFRDAIIAYQRRERWRRTWLPAIAAAVLVATAGGVGLWQWYVKVQHKNFLAAAASISAAAKSLNQLCRESEHRTSKRAALNLARQMPDDAEKQKVVEGFTRQLTEISLNIEDVTRNYLGALKQLRALPASTVDSAKTRALETAPEDERWATAELVSDYEAARSGRAPPSSSELLLQRCRTSANGAEPPAAKATSH
ncbi:MAG TPA: serine/threonine-protein kinase [Steroidobacteraceae bacterium]|nr:serine/threonine-protein kinase [Steroidobacteraceae bacterium]